MASDPLDVLLRVRMRYEAEAEARKAVGDLDAIGTKALKLGASTAGARLGRDIQGIATSSQAARREVTDLDRAASRLGQSGGVGRLQGELKGLDATAQAAKRDVLDLGQAARRLGADGARELRRELEQTGRQADATARKLAAMSSVGGVPGRAQRNEFGNEVLSAAGAAGALRFGMSRAGIAGVAVGAGVGGVAAGIAGASREARSFESAMADVRKAIDDLSPEKLAELESTILRTSRTTGVAKERMAGLVAEAGFAGRPSDDLARFAEFGAKASGAFGMSPEETGEKLAKLGNVFKLTQAGIEDLADGINVLGDSTASKERQIVDFLVRTGQSGAAIRLTALQTAAIGAAAIATGKEAEVAATGFNAFAAKLGDAKNQGKDFQEGLRGLGLNARRLKADMDRNPVEGFLSVLERINKLPENKRLEVTNKLGGLEYGDDLLAYAGAVDQIRAALGRMQDQSARAGSVEKTFRIFDATTQRSIDRASASMDAFATKVGQRFNPAIAAAARYVERLFGGMTKAIERGERAEALANKLAKGTPLSPKEQAEVDANPRLKDETDKSLFFQRRKLELDENRSKAEKDPGSLPSMDDARRRFEERAKNFEARRQRALNPPDAPALPGTGKRSDLREDAKVSLAAYHEEVEENLDRTERVVHDAARRMREDLAIKARIDLGVDRFGTAGGARIETAAYGGGGLGGGLGGGVGGSGRGGGTILPPGRFGIPVPGGRGYGGGGGSSGNRPPSDGDASRFGNSGGGTAPGSSAGNLTGVIEQAAREAGIDPRIMQGIRAGESGRRGDYDIKSDAVEDSYGPFQLNRRGGLGQVFEKETGLSLKDPKTIPEQARWVARHLAKKFRQNPNYNPGSEWYGYRGPRDADPKWGDSGYKPDPSATAGNGASVPPQDGVGSVDERQGNAKHRRQPITPELRDQLAYAGSQAGVNAEVFSGGQDEHGPNRFGSHRHDHGRSADVRLYTIENGRKRYLRSSKPADRERMAAFMRAGVQAGVTGIGHGPRYMGDDGIHMGGGSSLAWGAGGRAHNAPDWVREAHRQGTEARRRAPVDARAWAQRRSPDGPEQAARRFDGTKPEDAPTKDRTARLLDAVRGRFEGEAPRMLKSPPGDMRSRDPGILRGAPEAYRSPDPGMLRSGRFADPDRMQLRPQYQDGPAAGPMAGRGGGGRMAGGASVTQHFHGGFDEQATARRAVLEQNREVRRSQARALHDIGRLA